MPKENGEEKKKNEPVELATTISTLSRTYGYYSVDAGNKEQLAAKFAGIADRLGKALRGNIDDVSKPEAAAEGDITVATETAADKEEGDAPTAESRVDLAETSIGDLLGRDAEKEERKEILNEQIAFRELIGGDLPKIDTPINFDDPESINAASEKTLAKMLGATKTGEEPLAEAIKRKLIEKGVSEEKAENTKKAIQESITMRLMLGMRQNLDIQQMLNEQYREEQLEEFSAKSEMFEAAAAGGACDDIIGTIRESAGSYFKRYKLTDKLLKKLDENGHKIQPGLYCVADKDGGTHFVMSTVNEKNINKIVSMSKGRGTMNWSNIPSKYRKLAETRCLQDWKKVKFDKKETTLSRAMPKKRGNWAEWCKNIADPPKPTPEEKNEFEGRSKAGRTIAHAVTAPAKAFTKVFNFAGYPNLRQVGEGVVGGVMAIPSIPGKLKNLSLRKKTNLQRLVREVVGEDKNKLGEFWADIAKNRPGYVDGTLSEQTNKGMPNPADIFKQFTPEQKTILNDQQVKRINDLNNDIGTLKAGDNPDKNLLIHKAETQLKSAHQEFAQLLIQQPNLEETLLTKLKGAGEEPTPSHRAVKKALNAAKEEAAVERIKELARTAPPANSKEAPSHHKQLHDQKTAYVDMLYRTRDGSKSKIEARIKKKFGDDGGRDMLELAEEKQAMDVEETSTEPSLTR